MQTPAAAAAGAAGLPGGRGSAGGVGSAEDAGGSAVDHQAGVATVTENLPEPVRSETPYPKI